MSLSDNVQLFPGPTAEPFDPKLMLNMAQRANLTDVVIIGWDEEGDFFISASSGSLPENFWLIEQAKQALLAMSRAE